MFFKDEVEPLAIRSGDYAWFPTQPPVSLVMWDYRMVKNLIRLCKENNFYEQWHLIPHLTSGEKICRELKMAAIF